MANFNNLTVEQMKLIAKYRNLDNYEKFTKSELEHKLTKVADLCSDTSASSQV